MVQYNVILSQFLRHGGVLKTAELNEIGLSSRQIKRLVEEGRIARIKHGFYECSQYATSEQVVIARLFPRAVIFLESALVHYGYTDRIPLAWQIAVDRNSEKSQYKIDYPLIEPFYLEPKFLQVGLDTFVDDGVEIKIFNRERTICDVLRYERRLESETFRKAIRRYVEDRNANVQRLSEYAEIFNIGKKMQTYVGVWL